MPAPPGQFQPVPPPPIGQPAVVSLPGAITPVHRKYYIIQLNMHILCNNVICPALFANSEVQIM